VFFAAAAHRVAREACREPLGQELIDLILRLD
jgi:hypothetical protein